jgi:leishmanolysin-like peptidase
MLKSSGNRTTNWLVAGMLRVSLLGVLVKGSVVVEDPNIRRSEVVYARSDGRKLSTDSAYANLRVYVHFDDALMSSLTSDQDEHLRTLISDAVEYWQSALLVVPVEGSLKLQPWCASVWGTGVCYSYRESDTCGGTSDDPVIPKAHLKPSKYCTSCPMEPTNTCSGGLCFETAGGEGVDADFILYVASVQTSSCSDGTLAYAGKCQTDQLDRPIAGRANFCPDRLSAEESEYGSQYATAVHEIGHALGFGSTNLAYFRDPDTAAPMTPRDGDGNPVDTSATDHRLR